MPLGASQFNRGIQIWEKIMNEWTFNELVFRLEKSVLPVIQLWQEELKRDYPNTQILLSAVRSDNHPHLPHKFSYNISINCLEKGASKHKFGDLVLSINLSQLDLEHQPVISAYVGMLVDEESGDDWGVHPISVLFSHNQKVDNEVLAKLDDALPNLYQALRKSLGSTGVKQVRIQ